MLVYFTFMSFFIFNINSFVGYMQLHLLLFLDVSDYLYYSLLNQLQLLFLLVLLVGLQLHIVCCNAHNMFLFHFHEILLLIFHKNLLFQKKLLFLQPAVKEEHLHLFPGEHLHLFVRPLQRRQQHRGELPGKAL